MSKFTETVKESTPRLVVQYKDADGVASFQWGLVGQPGPLLQLIGYLSRVMSDIHFRNPDHCDEPALVIAWDGEKHSWFLNRSVPVEPLVGMLECIKYTLVGSRMAQQMAAQQVAVQTGLVAADGRPILKRPQTGS